MDNPQNGQVAVPAGYSLDVSPPSGYVLDSDPTPTQEPTPTPKILSNPYPKDKPTPLDPDTSKAVLSQYPVYEKYISNVVIHPGTTTADDDRQVETYPPSEEENPNPGKITIQPYRSDLLSPEQLPNTVAGELLHIIGGKDSKTGTPNDPDYYKLKRVVGSSRTPKEVEIDHKAYNEAKKNGETRPYKNWFEDSRLDEYIMGYVTPDKVDEWRKNGFYDDPKMKQAVESVKRYLTAPKKKTPTQQQ